MTIYLGGFVEKICPHLPKTCLRPGRPMTANLHTNIPTMRIRRPCRPPDPLPSGSKSECEGGHIRPENASNPLWLWLTVDILHRNVTTFRSQTCIYSYRRQQGQKLTMAAVPTTGMSRYAYARAEMPTIGRVGGWPVQWVYQREAVLDGLRR